MVHRSRGHYRAVRIVEVEGYASNDPASHAYRGPTERNRSMFVGPGTLYVFRIHQVYCANATTRRGEAVLLRSAEPLHPVLTNPRGPGRLCRAMQIDGELDGQDLTASSVRIVPDHGTVGPVVVGSRIGIRLARERRLRYYLERSRWISSPREVRPTNEDR